MCDTFVSISKNDKRIIFGKNSDREPNEAQSILRFPAKENFDKNLKCTYIQIPQQKLTNEILISKPYWMWGAEMGANEHGLVIGNEAVFTKIKIPFVNNGLIGMDLIRLALERTNSAQNALNLITSFIEQYGQNGNGSNTKNFYYHNSFIIADKNDAFVLETADKHWVVQKIKTFRSISNRLTIGEDFDFSSKGIKDFALKSGLLKNNQVFSFKDVFSDWFYTTFSKSKMRFEKSCRFGQISESFNFFDAIGLLSSHYIDDKDFKPYKEYGGGSVCMHATGFTNPTQTTGSMIAEISENQKSVIWFTGTSNPCISVYKPFVFGGKSLIFNNEDISQKSLSNEFWWYAEKLNRKIISNYLATKEIFNVERNEIQKKLYSDFYKLINDNNNLEDLDKFSLHSLDIHKNAIYDWSNKIENIKSGIPFCKFGYKYFFSKLNKFLLL